MKIETPQILWHDTHNMSAKDNGKSFPILSCHLVDSTSTVLATAGGCEINLWNVHKLPEDTRANTTERKILMNSMDEEHTKIEHLLTLSRGTNERTINCVRFSPDFRNLAAVGDGGLVVVWTLPEHISVADAGQWAKLTEEKELKFKIIYNQSDDVMDLSWSSDSKRFTVCSLDHTVAVFESDGSSEWKTVFRSTKDHTHYVQGVAFDPKGVYVASQGSDRSVKVYIRKAKEEEDLNKKFELGRARTIKSVNVGEEEKKEKRYLFADEITLGSFFRRLAFTPDGAFLVVPAALWHGNSEQVDGDQPGSPKSVDKLNEASFGTYLFARHCFEKPYKILAGLDKPSVVVRPNPLLFKLPPNNTKNTALPHRSIFAVLTIDTILIYDTLHDQPLAIARGLHYAGLTDAAWSNDGKTLFVTSSDGYVSILSFANDELGEPLEVEKKHDTLIKDSVVPAAVSNDALATAPAINILAPKKKKKVTVNLDANVTTEIENLRESNPVVVNTLIPKKKKKVVPNNIDGDSNKRTLEELSATEEVNVLVPKKKVKVNISANPEVNLLVPKKKAAIVDSANKEVEKSSSQ